MVSRFAPAFCACLLLLLMTVACGGDDDDDDGVPSGTDESAQPGDASETVAATSTPSGTVGGPEPMLEPPASRLGLFHADIGNAYLADLEDTFYLDLNSYAQARIFSSPEVATQMLAAWGYLEGYETGYTPEGREQAVLEGSYYVNMEVHLFQGAEGAAAFYDYLISTLELGSSEIEAGGLANQSSAWAKISEPIPNTDIESILHWFVFRRGNMVAITKTYGAYGLLSIASARDLAVMVDEKALGERDAVAPTPFAGADE